jgi:hypothetical protein
MLASLKVPRRRSTFVACRWCMAYSIVLQGSVTLQLGPSPPLEGSTDTAISAAAALWRHDAQQNRALKSEAATLTLRLEDGTRLLRNSLIVLGFAAPRCRDTGATWSRVAATRMKMAA